MPTFTINIETVGSTREYGLRLKNRPRKVVAAAIAAHQRGVGKLVIPAVRKRLPVRTGRLKRSLRHYVKGNRLYVQYIWYGRFQGIKDIYREELKRHRTQLKALARKAAQSVNT